MPCFCQQFHMVQRFGALFAPQPYHVTFRRWLMSRLPSVGSFAVSKGVSPLQSFSGSCLKCHGCIGGGTRSLASCIACPTCLRTAFMLRSSGTTLLMPRNTLIWQLGWWHCQAVQPPWHGLAVFVFWHNCLNSLGFQANMKGLLCRVWDGLHVSPRIAPSKRAKLCTYFAWFLRPSQLKTVPYFELPLHISRVRLLMQFRMGSHALPVEQGRLAKPAIPRNLRRCTLCGTRALGDERHFVFDCPHFAHIRRQFRSL